MSKGSNSALIERHSEPCQTIKVVLRETKCRRPQHLLALFCLQPQIKCADDLCVDLKGPLAICDTDAELRSGEGRKLSFEDTNLAPIHPLAHQAAEEGRHTGLNGNDRAL